jgi:hypothetical protein
MKSFSIKKKYITKVLYSGAFLGMSFMYASLFSYNDTTFNHLTVNYSMGIGGVPPNGNQGIFIAHQNYGAGNSNIYGYRGGAYVGGSSWDINGVESVFKGFSTTGDPYSAAVIAYSNVSNKPNSAALVASGGSNGTTSAAYLSYCDSLSANTVYSAYFNSFVLMGPKIKGQRWIIYTDTHLFTIAPDLGTNFDWTKNFTINKNGGQVGIGMTPADNSTSRLSVNGNTVINGSLSSTSITVTASVTPWPDFVFNKNYKPRPLTETELYIKKTGHLPGMPSKDDVAKNGINLGEMQVKMLKTMEEMTLQMIAMKKENEQLKVRLEKIEKY